MVTGRLLANEIIIKFRFMSLACDQDTVMHSILTPADFPQEKSWLDVQRHLRTGYGKTARAQCSSPLIPLG